MLMASPAIVSPTTLQLSSHQKKNYLIIRPELQACYLYSSYQTLPLFFFFFLNFHFLHQGMKTAVL